MRQSTACCGNRNIAARRCRAGGHRKDGRWRRACRQGHRAGTRDRHPSRRYACETHRSHKVPQHTERNRKSLRPPLLSRHGRNRAHCEIVRHHGDERRWVYIPIGCRNILPVGRLRPNLHLPTHPTVLDGNEKVQSPTCAATCWQKPTG